MVSVFQKLWLFVSAVVLAHVRAFITFTPAPKLTYLDQILSFIKSILKSLVILAIWLALSDAIYSRIALFFALNRNFFSANENGTVKQNNQSDLKISLK